MKAAGVVGRVGNPQGYPIDCEDREKVSTVSIMRGDIHNLPLMVTDETQPQTAATAFGLYRSSGATA